MIAQADFDLEFGTDPIFGKMKIGLLILHRTIADATQKAIMAVS